MRLPALLAALALVATPAASTPQAPSFQPPQHTAPAPAPYDDGHSAAAALGADSATQVERDRPAGFALAEHRRLEQALSALQPQRQGVVDAYVVAVGLDSDPVFGREARAAAQVLARRYGAAGRTIVLAGTDGTGPSTLPRGSPDTLDAALARVAELMDPREDVLILYTTSHGAPFGIVYDDGDQGFGAISPKRLSQTLGALGVSNRMVILSACFAGVFVPLLRSDTSVVVTAASDSTTSFGCRSENDWTFFGDALMNHAMRKPQPLTRAFAEARATISGWEAKGGLVASDPQISVGTAASRWLDVLERRLPPETPPVGRPALEALEE